MDICKITLKQPRHNANGCPGVGQRRLKPSFLHFLVIHTRASISTLYSSTSIKLEDQHLFVYSPHVTLKKFHSRFAPDTMREM